MRNSGEAEKKCTFEQYRSCVGSRIIEICAFCVIKKFLVEIGLHQGSALSPFLFATVMDRLTDGIRLEY